MVAVNYDWDELEDNIDEESDDSGNTIAEYTTEPYLYGDLISQRRSGDSRFHCYDGQGSTRVLTDDVGNVTDTYSYTAFGEVTEHTGSTENPFRYVGQRGYYVADSSGEWHVRRRKLLSRQGRWTSRDPLVMFMRATSPPYMAYQYVHNTPTTHSDPSGLLIPSPPTPRTPDQPSVVITRFPYSMTIGNYIVFQETGPGTDAWDPVLKINASVRGLLPAECKGKTYIVDFTVFSTVPANAYLPGIPLVDATRIDLFSAATVRLVTGACLQQPTVVHSDPMIGVFATFPFECHSPCDSCNHCQADSGEAWVSFGAVLVPIVVLKWEFKPTELTDDCVYEDCEVSLSLRQQ